MFKSESRPSPIWEMGNMLDNSIPSFWTWRAIRFDFSSNLIAVTVSYITDSYASCGIVGKGGSGWLIGTKNADQWICRLDGWNLQTNKTFSTYLYQGLIILDTSLLFTAWQRALEAERLNHFYLPVAMGFYCPGDPSTRVCSSSHNAGNSPRVGAEMAHPWPHFKIRKCHFCNG